MVLCKKVLIVILLQVSLLSTAGFNGKEEDVFKEAEERLLTFLESRRVEKEKLLRMERYNQLYELTIELLKGFEGYSEKSYSCPANRPTIGYGHQLRKGESFDKITNNIADSLLRADLEHSIAFVEKTTKLDRYQEPNKVLSLSQFVFNVGTGNFQRSTLLKCVLKGKSIEKELLKWTKYRSNGKLKHSNHLLKRRKLELLIFKDLYYEQS